MNPGVLRALVVDDDRSWRQILSEILADFNYEVDQVESLADAIRSLKAHSHRLAIVDLSLSPNDHHNQDGLQLLQAARLINPGCRCILLTGYATVELAVSALADYSAFTFLRKESFNRSQFCDIINKVMASAPHLFQAIKDGEAVNSQPRQNHAAEQKPSAGSALVVEDDAGWRGILEELLLDAGYHVRACASFGDALGYLRREKYILSVVDMSLKGSLNDYWRQDAAVSNLEGYQLLAATRANNLATIVVSGVASPDEIKRAYDEGGIFAYLEKQSFDPAAFQRLAIEARIAKPAGSELNVLTQREREVFTLLAQGLTNKEMAEKLCITTNTVKRHLKAIFTKLDIHTRSAAVAKAVNT